MDEIKSNERYFAKICQELMGGNLLYLVKTDSYLRQPCYSSRARDFFYIVLNFMNPLELSKIKYIQGEFPEFYLNYLTIEELKLYPKHCKWQFIFSPILYNRDKSNQILETSLSDHELAIAQAIIGVGHIARMYFLNRLDDKGHTWAIRQLGWALRYAELAILRLWNYTQSGDYYKLINYDEFQEDIEWLLEINKNWVVYENIYLANIDEYKLASLKLNKLTQYFSKRLAVTKSISTYYSNILNEYNCEHDFLSVFRNEILHEFKNEVLAFYLSGSSARSDTNKNSDIDTIIIFNFINDETMRKLQKILSKYQQEKISVYSLSEADLIIYPHFRFYSLNQGTKKIYGMISFTDKNSNQEIFDAIINNLFTISQIARAYLLTENFGPRAHYILKLMMKLADHGCIRLMYQLCEGKYPAQKEEAMLYFKENQFIQKIMSYILDINNNENNIKSRLLAGDHTLLVEQFMLLDSFSHEIQHELVNLKMKIELIYV